MYLNNICKENALPKKRINNKITQSNRYDSQGEVEYHPLRENPWFWKNCIDCSL